MNFTFALCLVVVLLSLIFEPIYSVKICISHVETCNDNVPVCGRFGRSNLCMNFKNRCALEIESCASTAEYTPVSAERCTGIPLNTRRSCYGLNNNNQIGRPGFKPVYRPGSKWPQWFGNGVNNVQTNTQVKPIIIKREK